MNTKELPYIAYYKRKGSGKIRNREVYATSWTEAKKQCPDEVPRNGQVWRLYGGPIEVIGLEGLRAPTI